jgi:ubiquitin carboxyl-terminal hydrolase 14
VSVKWQKELFKDVEIDTSQPPYVFKCQLYDLTGVPPERQKIMVKGGLLKVSSWVCRCCLNLIHILICSNLVQHT